MGDKIAIAGAGYVELPLATLLSVQNDVLLQDVFSKVYTRDLFEEN